MKRCLLIRHGLPDFPDGQRRCLGVTDIPLGEEGLSQAREMAASLPPITTVFSSPLTRAVQTAQAIHKNIIILEDLRELDYGQWDGLTFNEIRQRFPELYAARADDPTLPPPGAEPDAAVLFRFSAALAGAAEQSPGDFAVVAHGGVIALFLQSVTGWRYKPRYCEVVSLCWENGNFFEQEETLCDRC